jgi:hypothetical protein
MSCENNNLKKPSSVDSRIAGMLHRQWDCIQHLLAQHPGSRQACEQLLKRHGFETMEPGSEG